MARTLSEIYDAIALEKANMTTLNSWFTDKSNPGSVLDDHQTLLQDLTSTSKVAIWRLLLWIVTVATWTLEGLWDVFKTEVDTAINNQIPLTLPWYQRESLYFQYGDSLVWNATTLKYEYELYDETKRIITRAAANEGVGIVSIKVARDNNSSLEALTASQKIAFTNFWNKNKGAGVLINIISEAADLLKLEYQIFYDPLVLTDHGNLIDDGGVFPVEDAINNYIANLDFNGRFRLEECDAAIRSAEGVIDFQRLSAQSKYGANSYLDILVSKVAYAGYFLIDSNNPLADTIAYTANV